MVFHHKGSRKEEKVNEKNGQYRHRRDAAARPPRLL
jgi:hypothetical protein